MTPAGPNRRGPSARRAHRQACARSANSVRCSGLTPKVLKPTITADISRVQEGLHGVWPSPGLTAAAAHRVTDREVQARTSAGHGNPAGRPKSSQGARPEVAEL